MEIYLVRHGQTDWNVERRIQGQTDIPLNDTGKQQAKEVAELLAEKEIEEIYSSTMARAMETASAISRKLRKPAYMAEGLVEKGYGDAEGMTWDQVEKVFPEVMADWNENPLDAKFPGEGSESALEVLTRAYATWLQILDRAKGNIVIVSHGGTLSVLLQYLFRDSPHDVPKEFPNVGVVALHYNALTQDIARIRDDGEEDDEEYDY